MNYALLNIRLSQTIRVLSYLKLLERSTTQYRPNTLRIYQIWLIYASAKTIRKDQASRKSSKSQSFKRKLSTSAIQSPEQVIQVLT